MAASSSSSKSPSNSSLVPQTNYDVFISFRGEDIRDNFLSHLLKELRNNQIDVYVDERLERGDKISPSLLQGIEESSISLVIFSQDYASTSRWYIEELLKILEWMEHHRHRIVIPVFYKVQPSDVRHQTSSFEMDWRRSALERIANLSGFHYQYPSEEYKNECEFIEAIVQFVLKKLCDIFSSEEIKDLVGIDKHIRCIKSFLDIESSKVQIVGIWGMDGIGKTTIAKVVFDKYSSQYERCYFLDNVREESEKYGLFYPPVKFFSQIKSKMERQSGKQITYYMERLMSRKGDFMVLDDVSSPQQLNRLIGNRVELRPGSKVIFTTRDKDFFTEEHQVYEVQQLNFLNSHVLFCLNAFNKTRPEKGYEEQTKMAVQYANGIPLALKVLGSSLRSKSIKVWESDLEILKPHHNKKDIVNNVLRLSYDKLDYLEKEIFLDIAFFFKGKNKNEVISILDACDFHPVAGIDNLERKALITISGDNKIEMHDLIKKLGWEVVLQECIEDPGNRTRLRNPYDVMENNKGSDSIEGIVLDLSQIFRDLHLQADIFKNMPMLRILKVYYSDLIKRSSNVHLISGLESFSDELRYLEWDAYPLRSLPSSFCAEKLLELRMPRSKLSKLWDGVQDHVNLEIIDLSGCRHLAELPDFSKASKLREVYLSFCESLHLVHPSILHIHTLQVLNLNGCIKLKRLVGKIHFTRLHCLKVDHCSNLMEFSVTSEELRHLDLTMTAINVLHPSIGRLGKLEALTLEGLRITSLPNELCFLTSLTELNLSRCRALVELPPNIKALTCLATLRIHDCRKLRCLPPLPSSITALDAGNCSSLKTVISIDAISSYNLAMFSFKNCMSLDEDSLSGFVEVVHDTMMRCAILDKLQRQPIYKEGEICYPGSKVPEWFRYKTTEASISLQLDQPDHLFALFICFVLPSRHFGPIKCQWYLGDDERGKIEIPLVDIHDSFQIIGHVWYHYGNEVVDGIKEYRAVDHCTTHDQKISLEFTSPYLLDSKVKGCGVHPIYLSDIRGFIEKFDDKYNELVFSELERIEQEGS